MNSATPSAAKAADILRTYLHLEDNGRAGPVAVPETFWEDVGRGDHPELDRGRLMSAFTFGASWSTWERHPAGDEIVMLLTGAAVVILDEPAGPREIPLGRAGAYVLIPCGVWHTARTTVPTTMLFVTPGAGTEHRPV
jgi:mannose-6-phosphate isomerase-like protein (cupin superfamily)